MTNEKLLHVACTRECNTQQTASNGARTDATGTQQPTLKALSMLVLSRNRAGNKQAIKAQNTTQQTASGKPSVVAPEIDGAEVREVMKLYPEIDFTEPNMLNGLTAMLKVHPTCSPDIDCPWCAIRREQEQKARIEKTRRVFGCRESTAKEMACANWSICYTY